MTKNNRNFELTRKMGVYDVIQRTEDGFFNASNLIKQWNSNPLNKKKSIAEIVRTKSFQLFAKTLAESENLEIDNHQSLNEYGVPSQLMVIKKGKRAKCTHQEDQVWMNTYLFT